MLQNHLNDETIRLPCQTKSDPEIEVPIRPEIQVNYGKNLLLCF